MNTTHSHRHCHIEWNHEPVTLTRLPPPLPPSRPPGPVWHKMSFPVGQCAPPSVPVWHKILVPVEIPRDIPAAQVILKVSPGHLIVQGTIGNSMVTKLDNDIIATYLPSSSRSPANGATPPSSTLQKLPGSDPWRALQCFVRHYFVDLNFDLVRVFTQLKNSSVTADHVALVVHTLYSLGWLSRRPSPLDAGGKRWKKSKIENSTLLYSPRCLFGLAFVLMDKLMNDRHHYLADWASLFESSQFSLMQSELELLPAFMEVRWGVGAVPKAKYVVYHHSMHQHCDCL